MTALSNYAESLAIRWLFDDVAVTRPTAWYVALHTADPTDVGNVGELSGNGYARQAATFTEDTNGLVDNDADITFGPNTTTNWGSVSHVSVWDAVTVGNCLAKGALSSSVTINVNDSLKIAIGEMPDGPPLRGPFRLSSHRRTGKVLSRRKACRIAFTARCAIQRIAATNGRNHWRPSHGARVTAKTTRS
jgi:hypothetical protein